MNPSSWSREYCCSQVSLGSRNLGCCISGERKKVADCRCKEEEKESNTTEQNRTEEERRIEEKHWKCPSLLVSR